MLLWESLLVCKFDTDCLCSRPSAQFYTFISPESVILEHYIRHTVGFTPQTIGIALLNNERFWLGSKNKIFETINLPTKMIECLSKCQDYNQRLHTGMKIIVQMEASWEAVLFGSEDELCSRLNKNESSSSLPKRTASQLAAICTIIFIPVCMSWDSDCYGTCDCI